MSFFFKFASFCLINKKNGNNDHENNNYVTSFHKSETFIVIFFDLPISFLYECSINCSPYIWVRYGQGEFVEQSKPSLVGDHSLYYRDLDVRFREMCMMLVTRGGHKLCWHNFSDSIRLYAAHVSEDWVTWKLYLMLNDIGIFQMIFLFIIDVIF